MTDTLIFFGILAVAAALVVWSLIHPQDFTSRGPDDTGN